MARENWDKAFESVIAHEGGYVDHPNDPGGATNLGITIGTLSGWLGRSATKVEVRALTKATVKPIYKKNYWDVVRGDDLPSGVDYAVFDFGVNSGPKRSAEFLQRVVDVSADGRIGPQTLAAVCSKDASEVVRTLCDNRLEWLRGLRTWPTFGRGWERRVNEVRDKALSWVSAPGPAPQYPEEPQPQAPISVVIGGIIVVALAAITKFLGVW